MPLRGGPSYPNIKPTSWNLGRHLAPELCLLTTQQRRPHALDTTFCCNGRRSELYSGPSYSWIGGHLTDNSLGISCKVRASLYARLRSSLSSTSVTAAHLTWSLDQVILVALLVALYKTYSAASAVSGFPDTRLLTPVPSVAARVKRANCSNPLQSPV